MAKRDNLLTGYDVLKAAQRAGQQPRHSGARTDKEKEEDVPPPETSSVPPSGRRIGSTVLPSRRDILCYACSYEFQVIGQTHSSICPKCRTTLDVLDYTIDASWMESLQTAGTITIEETGVIRCGNLVAQNIILNGKVESEATIKAAARMQIGPCADFPEKAVSMRDLELLAGASAYFRRKLELRDVYIEGTLKAKVAASRGITIKAGGLLQGSVSTPSMIVEEGGGLIGQTSVMTPEHVAKEHPDAGSDVTELQKSA